MYPLVIISHENDIFRSSLQEKLLDFGYNYVIISKMKDILNIEDRCKFCIVIFDLCDDEFWSFSNSELVDTYLPKVSFLPVNATHYAIDDPHKIETYCNMVALTAKLSRWRYPGK